MLTIKDFKPDSTGKPLRYKILIKENNVLKILYNTGNSVQELAFKEYRVSKGDFGIYIYHD